MANQVNPGCCDCGESSSSPGGGGAIPCTRFCVTVAASGDADAAGVTVVFQSASGTPYASGSTNSLGQFCTASPLPRGVAASQIVAVLTEPVLGCTTSLATSISDGEGTCNFSCDYCVQKVTVSVVDGDTGAPLPDSALGTYGCGTPACTPLLGGVTMGNSRVFTGVELGGSSCADGPDGILPFAFSACYPGYWGGCVGLPLTPCGTDVSVTVVAWSQEKWLLSLCNCTNDQTMVLPKAICVSITGAYAMLGANDGVGIQLSWDPTSWDGDICTAGAGNVVRWKACIDPNGAYGACAATPFSNDYPYASALLLVELSWPIGSIPSGLGGPDRPTLIVKYTPSFNPGCPDPDNPPACGTTLVFNPVTGLFDSTPVYPQPAFFCPTPVGVGYPANSYYDQYPYELIFDGPWTGIGAATDGNSTACSPFDVTCTLANILVGYGFPCGVQPATVTIAGGSCGGTSESPVTPGSVRMGLAERVSFNTITPTRPTSNRPRVGFLAPCLYLGGGEAWQLALARATLNEVDWQGTVVVNGGMTHPTAVAAMGALMPVQLGRSRAIELARRCDIILPWGIEGIADLLAGLTQKPRVIGVCHAATESVWGSNAYRDPSGIDCYVAVSELALGPIPQSLRANAKIIWNAVDIDRLTVRRSRAEMRARWKVPEDALVAVYVGRLAQEKDPQAMLRLAANLPKPWHVVVVGEGPELAIMDRARASAPRVFGRFHLVGGDWACGDVLNASDTLVVPSRYESFGLTIAEGLWAGIPVVTGDVGLARLRPQFVRTVPVAASGAVLAEAVLVDHRDRVATAERVAQARQFARVELGPDRFARDWLALFREELAKLQTPLPPYRPAVDPAVRDAVLSCEFRGGVLPISQQEGCGCGGKELSECRAGKGRFPGRVTLANCLSCAEERLKLERERA